MRPIEVTVDRETRDRLETECDLLGFADVSDYVEWVLDNRAAIDQGTDRDQLLTAYADRVEELERELDERERASTGGSGESGAEGVAPRNDRPNSAEGGTAAEPAVSGTADATTTSSVADGSETGRPGGVVGEGGSDPTAETVTVAGRVEGAATDTTDTTDAGDGGTEPEPDSRGRELFVSGSFGERVGRITGDEVNEVVDELTGVETERVDAFARKAVAQTRERLGRDPETGLTYRSNTDLEVPGTRPGSDLADLDTIDVPGRSKETREQRRDAVGAALAFLRDEGTARRSEFVAELFEDYPAGYGSTAGWWDCVKAGLKQASVVDPAGDDSRTWEYDG